MNVLTMFSTIEYFDRYIPQMKAISERVDNFYILYVFGKPKKEWKEHFKFIKIELPKKMTDYLIKLLSSLRLKKTDKRRKVRKHLFMIYELYKKFFGYIPLFHIIYLLKNVLLDYKALKIIKEYNIDLYYALSGYLPCHTLGFLARKTNKPFIIRLRGNYQLETIRLRAFLLRSYYFHFGLSSLKKADLIIPISYKLKFYAKYWGIDPNKITEPISLGVDTDHFRFLPKQSKEFTIGCAGRLRKEKGTDRLIKLAKQFPNIRFLVCGQNQGKYKFPKNTIYLGRLPFESMPIFYSEIDILLIPSYTEGFPNVILEAYSCGRQILITKESCPLNIKVFGRKGSIDDFPTFIRELKYSDSNPTPEQIRLYAENFSWNKFGESMIKHFEELA